MKKLILGLIIVIGITVSVHQVSAKTVLSESRINAVIQILRAFDVDENKITDIVYILRKDDTPVIQYKASSPKPVINLCPFCVSA